MSLPDEFMRFYPEALGRAVEALRFSAEMCEAVGHVYSDFADEKGHYCERCKVTLEARGTEENTG